MMEKAYWDAAADSFEDDIFSVFRNDTSGLIIRTVRKHGSQSKTATDIGCGIGSFLPAMSSSFKSVLALDISPNVLRRAKERCASLNNVRFKASDISRPEERLPRTDFCLCVNVLLTPSLSARIRMLNTLCRHISLSGHLVLVVPSLESALLTNARRIEWNLKDGISASHAGRAGFPAISSGEAHRLRTGVVDVDGVPHKHFLKEEICCELSDRGMSILNVSKIKYPWSSEFTEPPKWMKEPYPWDWLITAEKEGKV